MRASLFFRLIAYTARVMVVGEFTQDTDVLVIGGGPGGYAAAFRAAELGRSVLIADPRSQLGGICLHEGCIPSKARLHRAACGAEAGDRGQRAIGALTKGLAAKAKAMGIEHVRGTAHFEDTRTVQITGEHVSRIRFKRAIIATGSRPDPHAGAVSPEQAAILETIPKTCRIIGHDYLALEAATMLAGEGAEVTLECGSHGLLPELPEQLIKPLLRGLKNAGITVQETNATAHDAALIVDCTTRTPNTNELRLTNIKVECDPAGWIIVDPQQRTTEPRIFAVGDVTGPPGLAGVALSQGRVAAEAICNLPSAYEPHAVPHVIYTNPNVAWCGSLDEHTDSVMTSVPWGYSGRAVGMDAQHGITMLHADRNSGTIIGAGLCGADACELIETAVLAIEMGATLEDLAAIVPAHPTRSELLGEAARTALLQIQT
jgi:dihydrolipoamide dehydrogenase